MKISNQRGREHVPSLNLMTLLTFFVSYIFLNSEFWLGIMQSATQKHHLIINLSLNSKHYEINIFLLRIYENMEEKIIKNSCGNLS